MTFSWGHGDQKGKKALFQPRDLKLYEEENLWEGSYRVLEQVMRRRFGILEN